MQEELVHFGLECSLFIFRQNHKVGFDLSFRVRIVCVVGPEARLALIECVTAFDLAL